ncbi:MAG: hypothetical protein HAW62_02895 [Endozoicomonadaceae bacterium]|nr:hypothetical protein [Endozoicomonadaceae bacterium]
MPKLKKIDCRGTVSRRHPYHLHDSKSKDKRTVDMRDQARSRDMTYKTAYLSDFSRSDRKHRRSEGAEKISRYQNVKRIHYSDSRSKDIDKSEVKKILNDIIASSCNLNDLERNISQHKTLINRLFDDKIQGYNGLPKASQLVSLLIPLFQYIEHKSFKHRSKDQQKTKDYRAIQELYQTIYQLVLSFLESDCFQKLQWKDRFQFSFYIIKILIIFYPTQVHSEKINSLCMYLIDEIIMKKWIYDQFIDLDIKDWYNSLINMEILVLILSRISRCGHDSNNVLVLSLDEQKTKKYTLCLIEQILKGLIKLQAHSNNIKLFDYNTILFSLKILISSASITRIILNQDSSLKNLLIVFYHKWSQSLDVKCDFNINQKYYVCNIMEHQVNTLSILHKCAAWPDRYTDMIRDTYKAYILFAVEYHKKYKDDKRVLSIAEIVVVLLSCYQKYWSIQDFEKHFKYQDYKENWFNEVQNIYTMPSNHYAKNNPLNILEGLNFFYSNSLKLEKKTLFSEIQMIFILKKMESYIAQESAIKFHLVIALDSFLRQHIQPLRIKSYHAYIIRISNTIRLWLTKSMREQVVPKYLKLSLYNIEMSGYDLGYRCITDDDFRQYAKELDKHTVFYPEHKKHTYFQCLYLLCQTSLFKFYESQRKGLGLQETTKKINILKESIQNLLLCAQTMHRFVNVIHIKTSSKHHLIYLQMYQEIYFMLYFFHKKNLVDEKNPIILEVLNHYNQNLLNEDNLKRAAQFRQETEDLEKDKTILRMPKMDDLTTQHEYCETLEDMYVSPVDLVFSNDQTNAPCSIYVEIQGRQHYIASTDKSDENKITLRTLKKSVCVQMALSLRSIKEPNHQLIFLEIKTPAYQKMLRTIARQANNFTTLKALLWEAATYGEEVTKRYLDPIIQSSVLSSKDLST